MMTLMEFCDKFRISHSKARRMMKAGVLLVSEMPNSAVIKIAETLAKRNPLSAADLCVLLESPSLALQLGRYSARALDQVDAIGDVAQGKAPHNVALAVADAARGDSDSVSILIDWIKRTLPDSGEVSHAWIACRLLLAMPANLREFENVKIVRALSWCRKSGNLDGWFRYETRCGRKAAFYFRLQNPLASFDL